MRRLFALLVLCAATADVWAVGEFAHGFGGGTGTSDDPYQIATFEHLCHLAGWSQQLTDFADTYFVMTADLTYDANVAFNWGWSIGYSNRAFSGTFDGQGHKIMSMTTGTPVFNYIGQKGVVRNLVIDGASTTGGNMLINDTAPLANHVLGLVENCHVTNINQDYTGTGQTNCASGMVGYLTQTGVLRHCSVSGQATVACGYGPIVGKNYGGLVEGCTSDMVITLTRGAIAVGGIGCIAQSYNNASTPNFDRCEFSGTIRQKQLYDGNKVGGICGDGSTVSIVRCSNRGTLISTGFTGGIVGAASGAMRLSECYNMGTVQDYFMSQGQRDAAYGMSDYVAGIAGQISGGTVERCFNGGTLRSVRAGGGLVGQVSSGIGCEATITDSYNAGLIDVPNVWKTGNTTIQKAGGLVAEFANVYNLAITHCLSVGTLNNAVAGRSSDCEYLGYDLSPAEAILQGNFYDCQVVGNSSEQGALTTARLTSGMPLDGFDPEVWLFNAGLYPQLRCNASTAASLLSATPYFLSGDETHTKVKSDFTVGDGNNVTWTLSETPQATLDGVTVHVARGEQVQPVTMTSALDGLKHECMITIYPDMFMGSGTAHDPYLITDYDDLVRLSQAINEGGLTMDGDYLQLIADIEMHDGDAILPLSRNEASPFLGTLDGNGHCLRGLTMRNDLTQTEHGALFGYVGQRGVIANLTIAGDANIGLYRYGGTIAAHLQGTVEGVNVLTPVIHSAQAVGDFGGIAGEVTSTGRVVDCYVGADVALTGAANRVGGVVSSNYGTVEGCQYAGALGGAQANYVGGLVAENYGVITDCLASGDVTAQAIVGAVAARCIPFAQQPCRVTGTLATGQVTHVSQVEYAGAAVGQNYGTFDGVWYDRQMGVLDNFTADGLLGKSTHEIVSGWPGGSRWTADGIHYPQLARFASQPVARLYSVALDWGDNVSRADLNSSASVHLDEGMTATMADGEDFSLASGTLMPKTGTCYVDDALLLSYQGLTRTIAVGAYGQQMAIGDGTEQNPWVISTAADLARLAHESNSGPTTKHYAGKHFVLGGDITLDSSFEGITAALNGTAAVNAPRWFRGVIDGAGHAINALNITSTGTYGLVGLVGFLGPDGMVRGLTIGSGSVQGTKFVGAVVGKSYGTVTHVANRAHVTVTTGNASAGSGGIVGYVGPLGLVSDLVNYGKVTNTTASGICYTAGVVGTVVGNGSRTFERLANYGNVSGPMGVAGVVASSRLVSYDDVVNYGEIVGTAATSNLNGGCLGDLVSTQCVNNARNYGAVSGSTGVGGVVARYITGPGQQHIPLLVTGCINAAHITGKLSNVGGIVGMSDTTRIRVVACANVGNITNTAESIATGTPAAGGIVGGGSPIIQHCYNAGVVSGVNCIGGLLGRPVNNDAQVHIEGSLNVGWLEGYAEGSALVGSVAGYRSTASTYSGVAYDCQMSSVPAVGKADVDGVTPALTADLVGGDRCYPVAETIAQDSAVAVATIPIFLWQGDARWQVTRSFELGSAVGAAWMVDSVFSVVGSHVNILLGSHGDYSVTVSRGRYSRTIPLTVDFDGVPGDINLDGSVDVVDVNIIINVMLGKDSANRYDGRPDVTGNGGVDVSDVNAVINAMLGR
ncbi:MAG: dockerin type I repeat-containing protein [Muribaculaceae bacterium]|nr:dockerin type I repeat-containing protein [Muribaculaceae bacterium]